MSDIGSLIFYIISFFISFVCYYLYIKHDKKIFFLISIIIPIIIGGFRYFVGTDYVTYYNMYMANYSTDIGFSIISYLANNFGGYVFLFFTYNFATIVFFLLGLKNVKKENRPIVYFCFLFLFFTTSFNIIRQSLTICIVFWGYKFILNKKFYKWLLVCLFASIFHTTSLLCIPFYFIINSSNKYLRIALIILILFFSINYIKILELMANTGLFGHYSMYIQDSSVSSGNLTFILDLLIFMYLLMFKNNENKKYYTMYILYLILSFTGFFNPYVKRIGLYFLFSKFIIISSTLTNIKNGKNRLLNYILIYTYVILNFIITIYILKQSGVIPYRFIGS